MRAQMNTLRSKAKGCVLIMLMIGVTAAQASADRVDLKNGDRLTGSVISQDENLLILEHGALGRIAVAASEIEDVVLDKDRIVSQAVKEPKAKDEALWNREVALGYNLSRGNTEDEQFSGKLSANRKTDHDEITLQSGGFYGASSRQMNAQRYDGMARYAFSFGGRSAWYNFYKLEGSHDRFANIDWRLIPSAGLGYWLADELEWKAMAEVGIGWEKTNFRDATANSSDVVLVPRAFASKTFLGGANLSQDLTIWPNVSDLGEYRLRSETTLTSPVKENLSLRLSVIDEFDSDPAGETKENDIRAVSSLVYAF